MEEKKATLVVNIIVNCSGLDNALRKAKELLDTLEKCGQATLEEN